MIWFVLIGLLASFGLLCAVWIVLGNWLTGTQMQVLTVHVTAGRESSVARRLLWLRDLGMVESRFVVVTDIEDETRLALLRQYRGILFLSPEQYLAYLEQERGKIDRV